MAAITVTTDITQAFKKVASNFELLLNKEYLLRPLAIETIPLMKERIHVEGRAVDGPIGIYSEGYLKLRQRRGRSEDTRVIVSLTRQLENDWAVIGTPNGYGIGFNNPFNKDKARWVEEIKSKIIFSLDTNEKQYITERLTELINGAINQ